LALLDEFQERDSGWALIKEIAITFEDKIDVLPITKEKYISFTKHVKDIGKYAF